MRQFGVIQPRWDQHIALMSVVNPDQALMRGLAIAFPIMRPGLFRSYYGRRSSAGHKAADGCSPAVVPPPPMREVQVRCGDLCPARLRLPCNSPHEASQFTSNCGANHRRSFSPCGQHAISSRQSALSLPRGLPTCRRRFPSQPIKLPYAQLRWIPVGPGTFNKHMPNPSIASLRYRAPSYGLTRGSLARTKPR